MRTLTFALSLTAALALAAPAAAKELTAVTLCGASGCRTIDDERLLRQIPTGGETAVPVGRPAAYYRVTFVHGGDHGHRAHLYYVPSANVLATATADETGVVEYLPIFGPTATRAMRTLARGVRPFAAPRLTAAVVGKRRVTGTAAQTYLRLFALRPTPELRIQSAAWTPIDLRAARPSPWTDSSVEFSYSREDDALIRGWQAVAVPTALADDVEAARALDDRGRGVPWTPILLSLLGAMLLAGLRVR